MRINYISEITLPKTIAVHRILYMPRASLLYRAVTRRLYDIRTKNDILSQSCSRGLGSLVQTVRSHSAAVSTNRRFPFGSRCIPFRIQSLGIRRFPKWNENLICAHFPENHPQNPKSAVYCTVVVDANSGFRRFLARSLRIYRWWHIFHEFDHARFTTAKILLPSD